MIKRYNRQKPEPRKYYRLNERITAPTLRVVDFEGKQIGILSRQETMDLARSEGRDVVEIASQAKPPVVKIIDFKKFLYQEDKKKKEEKKKAKSTETKEVRLGPFISDNDLQVMIRRCRDFLEDGDKVKLVVKFRGREITRSDFGRQVINKVIVAIDDIAKVDKEAKMEGRQMVAVVSPERKKQHGQTQNQESSSKTI